MIRGLESHLSERHIKQEVRRDQLEPVDVRLIRNKETGTWRTEDNSKAILSSGYPWIAKRCFSGFLNKSSCDSKNVVWLLIQITVSNQWSFGCFWFLLF